MGKKKQEMKIEELARGGGRDAHGEGGGERRERTGRI